MNNEKTVLICSSGDGSKRLFDAFREKIQKCANIGELSSFEIDTNPDSFENQQKNAIYIATQPECGTSSVETLEKPRNRAERRMMKRRKRE